MERILPIQQEMSNIVASGNYRILIKEDLARSMESLLFSFKKESKIPNSNSEARISRRSSPKTLQVRCC